MSLNPSRHTTLRDEESKESQQRTRKKIGRPHDVSPAIRAWGYPLLAAYQKLKGRAQRMRYKAKKMRQFKSSPLADPQAEAHNAFFPLHVTRDHLHHVRDDSVEKTAVQHV